MAGKSIQRPAAQSTFESQRTSHVTGVYSAEYLAEQERILARVREEGARRIRRSCEKATALGIIDEEGNFMMKELPDDMRPELERDFGG